MDMYSWDEIRLKLKMLQTGKLIKVVCSRQKDGGRDKIEIEYRLGEYMYSKYDIDYSNAFSANYKQVGETIALQSVEQVYEKLVAEKLVEAPADGMGIDRNNAC